MHVVVAGASGFLGTPLVARLRQRGHEVTRLVRGDDTAPDASRWDPASGRVDQALVGAADAVVNLSGANISRWPRTSSYAREILQSRLGATGTLARAIAAADRPPAFVSGSGMSWYGVDRGDDSLDESAGPGSGFLADVSQQWEAATAPAAEAGARVCLVRTSLVMDASGSALKLMAVPFRLGVGGRLGSGRQRMSVVSRDDWVSAVTFLVEHDSLAGPFNVSIPQTVTNAEFTAELGRQLHRPTVLAVPSPAIRLALGGIADDLLGSLDVRPAALEAAGFTFAHPSLASTLKAALS